MNYLQKSILPPADSHVDPLSPTISRGYLIDSPDSTRPFPIYSNGLATVTICIYIEYILTIL